jgi:hypothetical protein
LTTSTNLIKQAVLLQSFMAGEADNSFDVFKVGFELDRIISFPYRGFLPNKMLAANPSPTCYTNPNGVRIFTFSRAFIAFHRFPPKSVVFLCPIIFGSRVQGRILFNQNSVDLLLFYESHLPSTTNKSSASHFFYDNFIAADLT